MSHLQGRYRQNPQKAVYEAVVVKPYLQGVDHVQHGSQRTIEKIIGCSEVTDRV